MRIVVALGGNALLRRGEVMSAENQRANVRVAAAALAPLVADHELVVSHGNGPQVGLLALQAQAYTDVEAYPLDILGAQTEGMIGYLIEQELGNRLPFEKSLATVLTMTEVDPADPAFDDPTKFVGPVYDEPIGGAWRPRRAGRSSRTTYFLPGGRLAPAAAGVRDRADRDAHRGRLRRDLHRRRRDPDGVPARHPHAGGRRGRGGQGPRLRRPRAAAERRPVRDGHRRRRRVPGLGDAEGASQVAEISTAELRATPSRRGRWDSGRWRLRSSSRRRPGRSRRSGRWRTSAGSWLDGGTW